MAARRGSHTVQVQRYCIVLFGLAGTACLPIAHTVVSTPPVAGDVRLGTGVPAVGKEIVVVPRSTSRDCTTEATRTVTDSAGHFSIPGRTRRQRWVVLLPIEKFGTPFTLCVRDSMNGLTPAYDGMGTLSASGPAIKLFCVLAGATDSAACTQRLDTATNDRKR
jgi:hypothetical protein